MSMSQSRAVAVSQRSPVGCACWCSSCMCQAGRPGGSGLTVCTVMHANAGARLSRAEIERWGPCLLSHARVALESRTASSSFVARVALYSGVCCLFPRSLRYVVVCQCTASQGAVGHSGSGPSKSAQLLMLAAISEVIPTCFCTPASPLLTIASRFRSGTGATVAASSAARLRDR